MKKILLFCFTLLLSTNLFAAFDGYSGMEGTSADDSFSMSGSMGTEILTESDGTQKIYNKFSLQPEVRLGKLAVGLDLVFYFDEESNLRSKDWESAEKIIEKIMYIKYGEKRDKLFVYLGMLRNVSIGHGIIFNNYSNMLLYPDVRKNGLAFDIDSGRFGFETVTSNLIRMEIIGSRLYYRPMYYSSYPLLQKLAVGISYGTDVDPDDLSSTKNDSVGVIALDLDIPVFERDMFSAIMFFDVAQMKLGTSYINNNNARDAGKGYATGVGGKAFIFDYKAEYRKLENNFVYGYFDSFYELERFTKGMSISGDTKPMKEGPYFKMGYSLMGKLYVLASYEDYNNDPKNVYPWVHAEAYIHPSMFFDKFSWRFTYDKRNADTWKELTTIRGQDVIMKTEIGYHTGSALALFVIHTQTFDTFNQPVKRTSMEVRFNF